jgi:hypothetical protein
MDKKTDRQLRQPNGEFHWKKLINWGIAYQSSTTDTAIYFGRILETQAGMGFAI